EDHPSRIAVAPAHRAPNNERRFAQDILGASYHGWLATRSNTPASSKECTSSGNWAFRRSRLMRPVRVMKRYTKSCTVLSSIHSRMFSYQLNEASDAPISL